MLGADRDAGTGGQEAIIVGRGPLPPVSARVVGYAAAGWCLAFAGVSAWQVAAGPPQRYAADAAGLAIMSVLVGVLKLAGAALVGTLAVWFHRRHRLRWTSAVAGLAGALLLLGLLLTAAPALLGRWGLLPT